jgi:hypothetical protein
MFPQKKPMECRRFGKYRRRYSGGVILFGGMRFGNSCCMVVTMFLFVELPFLLLKTTCLSGDMADYGGQLIAEPLALVI